MTDRKLTIQEMRNKFSMLIRSPGSLHKNMRVALGVHSCGEVRDGVGIYVDPQDCGFVIAFKDLERFYLRAKAIREELKK